ncbi:MAG TPA: isocitrate lyase/phosphoenolpyruvate mutase family protein [Microscillaceae bacterium]|nr:isocitrate lyase/phosphoenolpyruvate mutase family protein [Microscillaceae bacterium]
MNFKELHQQSSPLLIANVWDVPSALAAENLQFQALGTSSAAIAAMLGYPDGEGLSFEELKYIVKQIVTRVKTPLSVDIEGGYSRDPLAIAEHIQQLVALGVVGVNIEDSVVTKGERTLEDATIFAERLKTIKTQLDKNQVSVFLNIRTDTFLLQVPDSVNTTQVRIKLYEEAGADGIFVPGLVQTKDITAIVQATTLPLNVMSFPGLPDFAELQSLGVKRISMGNFVHHHIYQQHTQTLQQILSEQSFSLIFRS